MKAVNFFIPLFICFLIFVSCKTEKDYTLPNERTKVLTIVEKGTSSVGFYTEEGELIKSLKLDTLPHEMRLSADRKFAYITNNGSMRYADEVEGGNTVSVINLQTMEKEEDIILDPFRRPHGIDIDHTTGYVAVAVENPDQVLLIDPSSKKIIDQFDNHGDTPHMVTISEGAEWMYVSNVNSANMVAINTKTKEYYSVDVGTKPQESAVSPDKKTLYVVSNDYTSVIDLETRKETHQIPGGGNRLELVNNGALLLISATTPRKGVSFVDTEDFQRIDHLDIPYTPFSIHVSEDEHYAYVSAEEQNIIYTVDVEKRKIVKKFKVENGLRPDPVQSFYASLPPSEGAVFNPKLPSYERVVVDSDFEKSYQLKSVDINGDGLPDLVSVSDRIPEIVWYENPSWEKRILSDKTPKNIDIVPYDVDGDKDMDLAFASGFGNKKTTTGGQIYWFENPGDSDKEWTKYLIDSIPTSHRLRWADINQDGLEELVNLPMLGTGAEDPNSEIAVRLVYYSIPNDPKTDPWPATEIDNSLHLSHGLHVTRWDNQPGEEILTASSDGLTLYSQENDDWKKTLIHQGHQGEQRKYNGAGEISSGILGGNDQRFLASIEPWHGNEVVVYMNGEVEPWERHVLDTTFLDGHAIGCFDLNFDGFDEVIAGHRGKPYNLYIYQYMPNDKTWQRFYLDKGGMAAAGIHVFDANLDGIPDIAACGTAKGEIVLYIGKL